MFAEHDAVDRTTVHLRAMRLLREATAEALGPDADYMVFLTELAASRGCSVSEAIEAFRVQARNELTGRTREERDGRTAKA